MRSDNMGLFGPEKITLTLEKYDYTPGEKIKGTIKLNLKKPTNARKLEISFIGKKIDKQSNMAVGPMVMGGGGGHRSSTQYKTIYNFEMPIAGEQEYQNGEYPFEIKIPDNILQNNPTLEGKMGQAATAFKMIAGVSSRIDWVIKAQLDVPKKLDIKKSQKIILSEG